MAPGRRRRRREKEEEEQEEREGGEGGGWSMGLVGVASWVAGRVWVGGRGGLGLAFDPL